MSKKEIENLLKAGKPKSAIKKFRRDALPVLEKLVKSKDDEVQRNAIIAYGVVGEKLGMSKKETEPFFKALEKISPQFEAEVADTIEKMGDSSIITLVNMLAGKKVKEAERETYIRILEKIGSDRLYAALVGGKVTSPADALMSELVLRMQTNLLANQRSTVYDEGYNYAEHLDEFKEVIKKALSTNDSDELFRALDAAQRYPTITSEFADQIAKLIGKYNDDVEVKILQTLGELGNQSILPHLVKQLEGPADDVRIAAVEAIGQLRNPEGVEALLKYTLNDKNEYVHQSTINALGKIGEPAAGHLVALLEKDQFVEAVEVALKRIGEPAVRHLVRAMAHKNKNIRKNATDVAKMILTTKYGVAGTVVRLIELLRDKDPNVQEQVVETIIEMGDPGLESVIRALGNNDPAIRESSQDILGRFAMMNISMVVEAATKRDIVTGAELSTLMAIYIPGEYEDYEELKEFAYGQLETIHESGNFHPAAQQAVVDNILMHFETFKDTDDGVRYSCAQIGYYLGKAMVPYLIDFLEDKNDEVVEVAIDSLGYIGHDAAVATSDLIPFANHKKVELRRAAVQALGTIGDPSAVAILIESLGDDDAEVQEMAQSALDEIGSTGIPALIDSMSHKNPRTRENLAHFIAKYGAEEVSSPLLERLGNKDENFQEAAVVLMGGLGPDFGQFLLSEITLIPDDTTKLAAVRGFGSIAYTPAMPYLVDMLMRNDKKFTEAVTEATMSYGDVFVTHCLQELDKGGKDTVKALSSFLKDLEPKYTAVPVVEYLPTAQKVDDVVDIVKKIGDKGVIQGLENLLERGEIDRAKKVVAILQRQDNLSKIAEKASSVLPQ